MEHLDSILEQLRSAAVVHGPEWFAVQLSELLLGPGEGMSVPGTATIFPAATLGGRWGVDHWHLPPAGFHTGGHGGYTVVFGSKSGG